MRTSFAPKAAKSAQTDDLSLHSKFFFYVNLSLFFLGSRPFSFLKKKGLRDETPFLS